MTSTEKPSSLEALLPLTALQEAMLVASLVHDSAGVYLTQVVIRLSGRPNQECWWQAWSHVTARHQALRCGFLVANRKQPVGVVLREVKLDAEHCFGVDDLRAWLLKDREQGFDIESPPLHRHRLLTGVEDDDSCVHVWTFHHAICDGWSTQLVIDEVFIVYRAMCASQTAQLPPAVTLKHWFETGVRTEASPESLQSLRAQQVGMVAPTVVPGAQVQVSTLEPAPLRSCQGSLSAPHWQALQRLAKRMNVTPVSVICAAWSVILAGLGRHDEVSFGVTFSGREQAASANLVGMVMHTMPVSVAVDAQAKIDTLVTHLNQRIYRMSEAGPLSWRQLRELRGEVSAEAVDSVPFYSLISFENVHESSAMQDQDLRVLTVDYVDQSNLPFSLTITPGKSLDINAWHHDGAVSDLVAERLLGFLIQSLKNFPEVAKNSVANWHYLSETERQQQLFDYSRSQPLATVENVVSRIQSTADRYPDRIAIRHGGAVVTYHSLWTMAWAVQSRIKNMDVNYVVLLANMGPQLLGAMLGILASGKTYVAVDSGWPMPRLHRALQQLADHAKIACIVDDSLALDLSAFGAAGSASELEILDLDALTTALQSEKAQTVFPGSTVRPDDQQTAYIMFTSGSTGDAKAVGVSHAALAASTAAREQVYPLSPTRFLLLSPFAFDSAVVGIYWTLCSGGELVLPSMPLAEALENLALLICRHRITHTLCLPSVHSLSLSMLSARNDHELQTVIVAGEACPGALPEQHARVLPEVELWNEYGPTESTVWCSVARLYQSSKPGVSSRVNIGKPVPGTFIHVVDYHDRPVPVGFDGELLVGGRLLADGYVGDPGQTAIKFIEDPCASAGRMYRSGDLVRWNEDADLEYSARLDSQVKIRGVRVETGDIETAIRQLREVSDVCVLQVTVLTGAAAAPSRQQLVAALVIGGATHNDSGVQRNWVAELAPLLPGAMLPQQFIEIPALPRLSNGKLDRLTLESTLKAAIAAPSGIESTDRPVDDLQQRVLEKLNLVLSNPSISVDQNLFDAGLDSLSAVRLLLAINQDMGCQLGIADLYAEPTVTGLARQSQHVDQAEWLRTVSMSAALSETAKDSRCLFFAYGNGARVAELVPEDVHVHWLIHGRGETVMPVASIESLATRHIEQMRSIQVDGPWRLAGFSLGALLAVEIARQLASIGEHIEWLGLIDPTSPNHFMKRGRHQRLLGMLKSDASLHDKSNYLARFVQRLPEFVRQRGQRRAVAHGSDLVAPDLVPQVVETPADIKEKLHSSPDHEEIIQSVNEALSGFNSTPVECPMSLLRVHHNALDKTRSLEWHDDEVYWREVCGVGSGLQVDQAYVESRHRDFFRDELALSQLQQWFVKHLNFDSAGN